MLRNEFNSLYFTLKIIFYYQKRFKIKFSNLITILKNSIWDPDILQLLEYILNEINISLKLLKLIFRYESNLLNFTLKISSYHERRFMNEFLKFHYYI